MNRNRTQQSPKSPRMNVVAALFLLGCVPVFAAGLAPASQADQTPTPRSVFSIPSNAGEGHDPFFPDSTRPYAVAVVASPRVADVTSLVLKGFSGALDRRLVIINNHTFAVGDEGDVVTTDGRIHLTCIEIKTNSVVIEVGGQRHELFYLNQP
jgi:hypothetical protein